MTVPVLDTAPVPTRTNRSVLLLLGLLLTAAGLLGLVLGFGGFGAVARERPVLDQAARSFAADNDWFWLAAALVALAVALLCLWWLRAQLASDRLRSLELERDRSRGTTTLTTSAVERACANELQSRRGIDRATATMLGTEYEQKLALVVSLDGRESLRHIDGVVHTEVLPMIRRVLANPELPVRVDYRLARRVAPRPR